MFGNPDRLNHYRVVLIAWAAALMLACGLAFNVTHNLNASGLDNPSGPAVWVDQQVARFKTAPTLQPLLIEDTSTGQVDRWAHHLGISSTWLHPIGNRSMVVVPPASLPANRLNPLNRYAKSHGARTLWVTQNAVGNAVTTAATQTLASSLPLALPLLAILLLLVFGSVAAGLLPLIVGGVGTILALGFLDLLENVIPLSPYLIDIVTFLALGVGVDYSLFISARFRQELSQSADVARAVGEAMRHAGRSVIYSAIAVTAALLTLLVGGTAYWSGIALGGAVTVLAILLVTHTLLPAILRALGPRINWGRLSLGRLRHTWPTIAGWIRQRPCWALALGILILGLPSLLSAQMNMQTPANAAVMLPESALLRRAMAIEQKVWGAGTASPIIVLLDLHQPLTQISSWRTVQFVTTHLAQDRGVQTVSSATEKGPSPAALARAAASSTSLIGRSLLPFYTRLSDNNHLAAIFLTARSGPNQSATRHLIQHIDDQLHHWLPGMRSGVGGPTALMDGFTQLTDARLPWMLGGVATVAIIVLFAATGSWWLALLGVVFDGLVTLATAGILVATVQHGLFGLEPEALASAVTPLVFVLLFGLSMDYEVILLHRIQEVWRQGHSVGDAVSHGLTHTGGMITGAGMIMVVAFLAMLISPLEIMQTLAIGLTTAILLDTWIVRSMLVPGSITVLGRYAFWPARRPFPLHVPSPQQKD